MLVISFILMSCTINYQAAQRIVTIRDSASVFSFEGYVDSGEHLDFSE